MDNATEPDVGSGPYAVEHSEDDGFYYVTLHGARTGKSYPIGKTAYRAVRRLNDDDAARGITPSGTFLEDEPKPESWATRREKAGKPRSIPKPAPEPEVSKAEQGIPGHAAVTFQGTREEWLNAFTAAARPEFIKRGFELPEKVHASVGFMFRNAKALGQCWRPEASEDGVSQIFINPTVAGSNSWLWAGIMTHELCHAGTPGDKHGPKFKQWANGVGLEGKATQAVDGPEFREWAAPILEALGPIPHSAINPAESGVKKQTTRLLKAECEVCGFIFRATAKHLDSKALRCPDESCDGMVHVEGGEDATKELMTNSGE